MFNHKKNLLSSIVILLLVMLLSQSIVLGNLSGMVKVNVNTLNVRSGPSINDSIISQINKNEQYEIIDEKNKWYKIKLKSKEGWVAGWLVEKLNSAKKSGKTLESTVSILNVRSGPSQSFSVIDKINSGTKYLVLDEEGKWVKIQLSANKFGWVAKWYSNISEGLPSTQSTKNELATIHADVLNIRSGPSTNNSIIGQLFDGDKIEILSIDKTWYKIKYKDSYGWIASEFTNKIKASTVNENIDSTNTDNNKVTVEKVYVSANKLNLRSKPNTDSEVIKQLAENDVLIVNKSEEDWLNVTLEKNSEISGWVAKKYVSETKQIISNKPTVTIINPGTNLREGPSTSHKVVAIADSGDEYPIIATEGEWYKILLPNNKSAYVAGWIVTAKGIEKKIDHGLNNFLKGKVIVVDAGHGGKDEGATGTFFNSKEKKLNITVAKILQSKLEAAGAKVIMTRTSDTYPTLQRRVDLSIINRADAFISIHHNFFDNDSSINGTMTYYYYKYSKQLAKDIHSSLISNIGMKDLNVRNERYFVLRENPNPAVLIELGFLSNYNDEVKVNSAKFQENAAEGIFQGILKYFKK